MNTTSNHWIAHFGCLTLLVGLGLCAPASAQNAAVSHVVHMSLDGLGAKYLQFYVSNAPAQFPNFIRLRDEGAYTFNARCDYDISETVPNHACMFTGRPVMQPAGAPNTTHHGYNNNFPGSGDTFHISGNPNVPYKASFFDVAHDHGLPTALYTGKTRLGICDRSYDAANGAPDVTGTDNGKDKIDFASIADVSGAAISNEVTTLLQDLNLITPKRYSFIHIAEPDLTGHSSGWGSANWSNAVRMVDTQIGRIITAINANPTLSNRTALIVSADHGGGGVSRTGHTEAYHITNYTIPFFLWGPNIPAGTDAYALFTNRRDPGTNRTDYTVAPQPLRSGDGGNLALSLLGLPSIPGSFMLPALALPNRAPVFVAGPDQSTFEDSGPQTVSGWATGLSAGSSSEAGQTLTFLVSHDSSALFIAPPTIDPSGNLGYTPAPDANGSATVTVRLMDDGGTANGGQDTSAPQTFVIAVAPVNDVPSFTKGADLSVLEDSGSQTTLGWATDILAGPANEATQPVTFNVINNNPGLFSTPPTINSEGVLTFAPAPNAHGTAVLTVLLQDGGGTANGGQDTSAPQTFTISVLPVNDPPSFAKGPDVRVSEDSALQTIPSWATAIMAGPANETGQPLSFIVNNDNSDLFTVQPALSPSGTLTFQPATDWCGAANVSVVLIDNDGTDRGGIDRSAMVSFRIEVNEVNDCPVATAQSLTVNEDASLAITLAASDVDSMRCGPATLAYRIVTQPVHGTLTGTPPNLAYQPNAGYPPTPGHSDGTDSFTFAASDGTCESAPATVNLVVKEVNDPPQGLNIELLPPACVLIFPGSTDRFVLTPNGNRGCVLAFGSATDPEGDTLDYSWLVNGLPAGTGATTTNCFEIGCHTLSLIVSDGSASSSTALDFCVITPGEAVEQCIDVVNGSSFDRKNKRPLLASLKAAIASFDRGSLISGRNQLQAFQNKVRAQLSRDNPAQAIAINACVQQILDALDCAEDVAALPTNR